MSEDLITSVIIYGPPKCGKTKNAEKLAKFWGLKEIVDHSELGPIESLKIKLGTLYLICSKRDGYCSLSNSYIADLANSIKIFSYDRAMELLENSTAKRNTFSDLDSLAMLTKDLVDVAQSIGIKDTGNLFVHFQNKLHRRYFDGIRT